MIRRLAEMLRKSVNKRSISRRRECSVPVTIKLGLDHNTGPLPKSISELTVTGETCDLSSTGIGFVVSTIRLREYYLVGEERLLNAEISLPNGLVKMQIIGQRYEQVGQHVSATQYLVGARIVKMSDRDSNLYMEFLSNKKVKSGSLTLGIDEG
ncbi:MAG: hypothetical protein KDB79_06670 [Acidobacteria bacterium]|nr:hypothetical protein [Acidobacteriota bacterium]